ncbi:MAG: HAMP domain-containing histidine kinase [Oscillospiraceae bacterium]|nr:HAMP domain-containing histidine kinase [Oscillospiraceae bacterium]
MKRINLSAKLRLTAWFTLMILLLSAMVLVFVFVINGASVTDDPAGRLVKVVQRNAASIEFDNGGFEWADIDFYRRGVYCSVFDADGRLLRGAAPESAEIDLPFESSVVREARTDEADFFVYDVFVDMSVTTLWVRGVIDQADRSGLMHTIMVLTWTLLPAILILSVGGGWLIAWNAFRPMETIMRRAGSISDGDDLSARLDLRRGPSEMRRLGHTFDRMFARLEASFNAERQFASDAAHELRTPVAVILAQCDRARRKCKTPEDYLKSLDVIEAQGRRMSELIDQLLSLTRLQQGVDRYPLRETDLSEFITALNDEFVPLSVRGITREAEIEPGITARVNPTLTARIVQNLLQNAYKYGKEGGHVWLSLKLENGAAVLRVADDGIGIAPEDVEHIWQRFWQADASRGEDGGSGLGLAMVREMAEFMGGEASVESTPGAGSTFTVTLPAPSLPSHP